MEKHIPVMANEVLEGLNLSPGASIIDATVGLGGHSAMILDRISENGTLYAFDRDGRNLETAKKNLANWKNVVYHNDSFGNMNEHSIPKVDGVLFDLGFSSVHVDDPMRGFSFQREGPLDMRYDKRQDFTAEVIVNSWSQDDLAEIFRKFGEEQFAHQIAKTIVQTRRKERIVSTTQLADIISSVIRKRGRLHPATKVFQSLRMVVNDELGQVEKGVQAAISLLKPEGRIVVISFHSQEDRLIKQAFKNHEELEVITKRPLVPTFDESKVNPRARSAKLRVAQKI